MEIITKHKAIKLRSHLDKYLVADDDQETIRQSRNSKSRRALWIVETVEGRKAIRLKSCHGRYLTATDLPFLLGMTGSKVLQTIPDKLSDWRINWEPVRDGFQVRLRAWCGTYLRANGGTAPWRNSITHDEPSMSGTKNWVLWNVHGADDFLESESVMGQVWFMSNYPSFSSEMTDDVDRLGSQPGLPAMVSYVTTKSPRMASKLQTKFSSGMDLFHNAKAVRLRSHHEKYLLAEEDEESVTQDRKGSSKNARWTVEYVSNSDSIIRLKSCYGKYLTASNQPFLLGMTGRKVLQTFPRRLDSSLEWEPIREGNQMKLKTRYGNFLRANGGLPPWRNSITHDIPNRTATQDWILWDVDVVEINVVQSPVGRDPPALNQTIGHLDSLDFDSGSPSPVSAKSDRFSRQESSDSTTVSSPPKSEGRTIYYHGADEHGGVDDEAVEAYSFTFKGNGVVELTHKLEEETGLEGIIVCTRSPLNGKLFPLRLQLPPNNATMHVVVVPNSSRVARDFAKQGLC